MKRIKLIVAAMALNLMAINMAGAVPLNLISHTGVSSSSANVFGNPVQQTDTPSSATDQLVSTSATSPGNVSGVGGGTSASASTLDRMSTTSGDNVFTFSHLVNFSAEFSNPGGSSSADIDTAWSLTLNVASVDLSYAVSRLAIGPNATSSSNLTVRNATTNIDILTLVDPGSLSSMSLNFTGTIGDLIEISLSGQSDFSGAPGAPSVLNRTLFALTFTESAEQPVAMVESSPLAIFALGLVGLAFSRHRWAS